MALTVLVSKPSLLRYYVVSVNGSAVKRTITELLSDMAAGPLKKVFAGLTASWGTGETPSAADGNPISHPRITTIVTPLTTATGGLPTSAALRYFIDTATNTLEILGGLVPGTSNYYTTNCIVEIRFNHSLE